MASSWWMASNPDLVVTPGARLIAESIHDGRFVDRESVQPGPRGSVSRQHLAEVLAAVGDINPVSLYETIAEDVTALVGPSVHCYFRRGADALVESVDPAGWRRFTFVPEERVLPRLLMDLATVVPFEPGHLMACALDADGPAVLLSDGINLTLGDLPATAGPVRDAVLLQPEDVQLLMLARLRTPALA